MMEEVNKGDSVFFGGELDGHRVVHENINVLADDYQDTTEDNWQLWDAQTVAEYVLKHLNKDFAAPGDKVAEKERKAVIDLFEKEGLNGKKLKDLPQRQWLRIVRIIEKLVELPLDGVEVMRGDEHPLIATLIDVPSKLADVKTGIWFAALKYFNRKPQYDAYYLENEMFCHNRNGYPYFAPRGWRRYGFYPKKENESDKDIEEIMKTWHVAYHGTKKLNVDSIVKNGLVPPGCKVDDQYIKTNNGSVGASKDSKPIYVSPSIEYAAHRLYTQPYKANDGSFVYCVLQVRVKPNSFTVQHNTLWDGGWKDKTVYYDENFHSDDIEWLINNPECIRVTGLMVKKDKVDPKERNELVFDDHEKKKKDDGPRKKNNNAIWLWNAELTGGNVLSSNGAFKKYHSDVSKIIEKAWVHHQKYVFLGEQPPGSRKAYYIDFVKMEQLRCDDPKLRRNIKREIMNPIDKIRNFLGSSSK